jgi:hypothetical protein
VASRINYGCKLVPLKPHGLHITPRWQEHGGTDHKYTAKQKRPAW